MPGRKARTNPVLILLTILMCLGLSILLTQSSADTTSHTEKIVSDTLTADNSKSSELIEENKETEKAKEDAEKEPEKQEEEAEAEPSATPALSPEPTPAPAKKTAGFEPSPEAAEGVWTPSGSQWLFMVDGNPYTGWLTDTDGKRYFFDEDGIMQIGLLVQDGKRYFLNLDGIMQTGDITIEGETLHFLEDGSQEGYVPETTNTPTPESKDAPDATETPVDNASAQAQRNAETTSAALGMGETVPVPDKTIALTFDDGPSSYTDRLLSCLEANNAKATFFMVGEEISYFPEAVKRMQALGCELGNHTYDHTDLTSLSPEDISAEIAGTDNALVSLTGNGASVVRPPYGAANDSVKATVGTPMILWSVDTLDWETLDVQQTVDTVLSQAEDGAIILMHDIYETSVEAAEIVIPKLIAQGYRFVTVHELAAAHGVDLKPGILYGSMGD